MRKIERIMVAVDLSDYSLPSVQYAMQLAQALRAEIILVNVYNQRDISAIRTATDAYYDPGFFDKVVEENKTFRRNQLDNLAEQAGARDLVKRKLVRIGVPHQELIAAIEEEKADMLVMGTKGRSNLADTIVGSVARKMVHSSPVPLVTLPPGSVG